jgi:hypothetical protein
VTLLSGFSQTRHPRNQGVKLVELAHESIDF